MRGLDPRIHPLWTKVLTKMDGLPGHKRVYARFQRAMPGNDGTWIGVSDTFRGLCSLATRSLPARHVQAGIIELQGGVADRRVDLPAVDAGSVDAGLRKFISAVIVTFIDEDVVIDAARNDVKLGVGDVSRGELGVVLGRRLGVARRVAAARLHPCRRPARCPAPSPTRP